VFNNQHTSTLSPDREKAGGALGGSNEQGTLSLSREELRKYREEQGTRSPEHDCTRCRGHREERATMSPLDLEGQGGH
jgi:hypothetical protein